MSEYIAPVKEIKFTLSDVVGIDELTSLEQYQDATDDIIDVAKNGNIGGGGLCKVTDYGAKDWDSKAPDKKYFCG